MKVSISIVFGLIILSAVVSAQLPTNNNSSDLEPKDSYNTNQCYKLAMKNLLLATDISDPNQESYIRAADAYLKLDTNGQVCQ